MLSADPEHRDLVESPLAGDDDDIRSQSYHWVPTMHRDLKAQGAFSAANEPRRAYMTMLAANCNEAMFGVVGLAKGLKKRMSKYPLVVVVLPDVSEEYRMLLADHGCTVKEIEPVIRASYVTNYYSKLRIWEASHIRLIKPYMIADQSDNVTAVNEAPNEIYIQEEDYDRLRESIDLHDSFDQISLAQKLEKHELLEMRSVAAYIYKKAGRWKQSIALSKKDNHYKDCTKTCSQSGDHELSEELLIYFIEQGKKECFAACLFVCYDMIRPDVALELAWTKKIIDFALPYLLLFIRTVDELIKDKIEAQNDVKAKEKEEKELVTEQNMYAQLLPPLPSPPGMGGYAPPQLPPMPPMGGMGMPPIPPFGMPQMGPY